MQLTSGGTAICVHVVYILTYIHMFNYTTTHILHYTTHTTHCSGFDGPWTNAPTTFSNEYFVQLLDNEWQPKQWYECVCLCM
jgi:hypothetical protein